MSDFLSDEYLKNGLTQAQGEWVDNAKLAITQPIISIPYAARATGLDEAMLAEKYGEGAKISLAQFLQEYAVTEAVTSLAQTIQERDGVSQEIAMEMAAETVDEQYDTIVSRAIADAMTPQGSPPYKQVAIAASAAHSPGGEFSADASRSEAEAAQAREQYGASADFYPTAGGRENFKALRVQELFKAGTEQYSPATGDSGFLRGASKYMQLPTIQRGIQNAAMGLLGQARPISGSQERGDRGNVLLDPFMDSQMLAEKDGQWQYANLMWDRGRVDDDDSWSVYTPSGRPRYWSMSATTPEGMAQQTWTNASYPLGWLQRGALEPLKYPGRIAAARSPAEMIRNFSDIGRRANRVTPIRPDFVESSNGMTPQQALREFGNVAEALNEKGDDYRSAYVGPAITGGKSFLSPMADTMLNFDREMLLDATNVVGSFIGMPIVGGIAGAGKSAAHIARAAASPKNYIKPLQMMRAGLNKGMMGNIRQGLSDLAENAIEEGVFENPFLAGVAYGDKAWEARKENKMAGNIRPDDPEYYKKLDQNVNQYYQDAQDISDAWSRATGRQPANPMDLSPMRTGPITRVNF